MCPYKIATAPYASDASGIKRKVSVVFHGKISLLVVAVGVHGVQSPNKAPEPTPVAGAPRALSGKSDREHWTENRCAARGAPATVVAHL